MLLIMAGVAFLVILLLIVLLLSGREVEDGISEVRVLDD